MNTFFWHSRNSDSNSNSKSYIIKCWIFFLFWVTAFIFQTVISLPTLNSVTNCISFSLRSHCYRVTVPLEEISDDYILGLLYHLTVVVFFWLSSGLFCPYLQGCYAGTGATLPQCQWSNPEEYGKGDHMNPIGIVDIIITKQNTTNHVHISWDILYMKESMAWVLSLLWPEAIDQWICALHVPAKEYPEGIVCWWIVG